VTPRKLRAPAFDGKPLAWISVSDVPARDEAQRSENELVVLLLVRATGGSRSVDTSIPAAAECPNGTRAGVCRSPTGSRFVDGIEGK
jgi:hypothetical protein